MTRPAAILLDIEGTTTPIAFVHKTLFPFARERMADFVAREDGRPEVAAALAEVRALAPGQGEVEALLGWMQQDAKVTPLKALQGMIWREGFESGQLRGQIYADVPPALRRWHAAGIGLHIYSSGSEEAQRLIYTHSDAGDLANLFGEFFDTRVGAKRSAASYRAIAARLRLPPARLLFLSDVEAELDAARLAGLSTCQLVRAEDGTQPSARHRTAANFGGVEALLASAVAG